MVELLRSTSSSGFSTNDARIRTSRSSRPPSGSCRRSSRCKRTSFHPTTSSPLSSPMLRYFSLYLLFLAISAQSVYADLVPNYDNTERELKAFDERIKKPLTLTCSSQNNSLKLSWKRNGVDVGEVKELTGRFKIDHNKNSFVIEKPEEHDAGKYTCSIPELNQERNFNVVANVYFRNKADSMAVIEGEKLSIHCKAFGTAPNISWAIGNETYRESRDRVLLTADNDGIENAILTIEVAVLADRAFYNCTVTNDATLYGGYKNESESTYVRVKGKWAAFWPFAGIVAEVVALCVIILVYEKRRNKAEMDESDTDQSPEQEKLKEKK